MMNSNNPNVSIRIHSDENGHSSEASSGPEMTDRDSNRGFATIRGWRVNLQNAFHDQLNSWIVPSNAHHHGGITSIGGREVTMDPTNNDNFVVNVPNPIQSSSSQRLLASPEAPERIQQIHRLMMHHHGVPQPQSHTTTSTVGRLSEISSTQIRQHPVIEEEQQPLNPARVEGAPPNRVDAAAGTGRTGNIQGEETLQETMRQIPELHAFIKGFLRYLPFLAMVFVKATFDHFTGIINFCILFFVFTHANHYLKQEITKKHQKNTCQLSLELLYVVMALFTVFAMPEALTVFLIIFMQSFQKISSLSDLLYCLLIADLILKLFTIAVKIVVTLMPNTIVEFKGRGRIYLLVEAISQFYRSLTPILPWIAFLLYFYDGYERVFGSFLIVFYTSAKARDILLTGKFLRRSFKKFRQNSNFGISPTKDQE